MKGHLDAGQLKSMDYKSLQALAKDMGVSAAGKAEDIIARIAAVKVDVPEESQLTEEEKALFDAEQQEKAAAEAARREEERTAREQAALQAALQEVEKAKEKEAAEQKAREEAAQAAGLITVKAVTRFLDKQLNQIKDVGEAYSVGRERAAELAAAGVAEIQ